ncbi:MAG: AAA family ATPase [Candidatus Moranbacteria bacterium]|nr:AAA family ATPase [Candidatus Moranbacteria bacterium]
MVNQMQKESILDNLETKSKDIGSRQDKEKNGHNILAKFKPLSMDELLNMDIPPTDWLVEKLIPKEGITIIAGPPGNFKTWLLINMAINISRGDKLFDTFKTQQAGILIIDEENHLRILKQRILLLGGDPDLDIRLISKKDFIVTDKQAITEIIKYCKKEGISVIIIDSLVRIHKNDENSAKEMNVVFRYLGQFYKYGITVIITHHEKKEGFGKVKASSKLRGSTDILASCDSLISIKAKEKNTVIEIQQPKSREEESINPFELKVCKDYGLLCFQYIGQEETSETNDEMVINILKKNQDGLLKKDIEEIAKNEYEVNKYKTRESLRRLERLEKIIFKKGKGTSKLYYLRDNNKQSNLEF